MFACNSSVVHVHMAPATFGIRTSLQKDLSVPEPLIWVDSSDEGKRLAVSKAYPPLRRLTVAQRKECARIEAMHRTETPCIRLESKLLGKDEALLRLCAALQVEGRDALVSLREQHLEEEQAKLMSGQPPHGMCYLVCVMVKPRRQAAR